MADEKRQKLSTDPYKGVRDFYPEDMAVQNYIFDTWRRVVERFGYAEYSASILEPVELYRAKSGEEIVNEQMYVFTDRGEREVALRPEMTPSVARMVAAKRRELPFPLRWYSIPNLFRYERPQRGRLREHWQLNVDLFGAEGVAADAEIIMVAYGIMNELGAGEEDFVIRMSHALLLRAVLKKRHNLDNGQAERIVKILDKTVKGNPEQFANAEKELDDLIGKSARLDLETTLLKSDLSEFSEYVYVRELERALQARGISPQVNVLLTRGFDYYTGAIFEVFDTNPANRRSLFGGGRYDKLLEIFDAPPIPAVGFGMGDVTVRDFLETHDLLPSYAPETQLFICTTDTSYIPEAEQLANRLRAQSINVALNLTDKKIGVQIALADKQKIPFVLCVGEEEIKTKRYKVKRLSTGEEIEATEEEIKKIVSKT